MPTQTAVTLASIPMGGRSERLRHEPVEQYRHTLARDDDVEVSVLVDVGDPHGVSTACCVVQSGTEGAIAVVETNRDIGLVGREKHDIQVTV